MIYFATINYKRGEISKSEVTGWVMIWSSAAVIVVFPEILREFAGTFLVTRVFDLMVIAGFILVISMVGSAYLKTKRIEKKFEDMVRREALKEKKK